MKESAGLMARTVARAHALPADDSMKSSRVSRISGPNSRPSDLDPALWRANPTFIQSQSGLNPALFQASGLDPALFQANPT
jgi:hypothetical protein